MPNYANFYFVTKVWDRIINHAAENADILKDMAAVKQIGSILKTNVRACKALGHNYVIQLGCIYLDMLNVYKIMSENISQAIHVNGVAINNQPLIKAMHVVKKETLTLISEWIVKSNDPQMVMENFIPPLLDAVLLDYQVSKIRPYLFLQIINFLVIAANSHSVGTRTNCFMYNGSDCQ